MDRVERSQLALEEIDLLPRDVRDYVFERDGCDFATGAKCRLCGRWSSMPAIHHITFRSHGGLDIPSNLIVLGQDLYGHNCHALVHGTGAKFWREVLSEVVLRESSITGLAYARWKFGTDAVRDRVGRGVI